MTLAPDRPPGDVPGIARDAGHTSTVDATLTELAASADPRITASNKMTRYRLGVLAGDVLVLVGVSLLAGAAAGWPATVRSSWSALDGATMQTLGTTIAVAWLLALFVFSGYSRKRIGAGTDEYASVALATTATAGLTAMVAYLSWTDLPRDYVLVLFGVGLAGLGIWRFTSRRIVRAIRLRDAYVIPTVLLGTQLVNVLRGEMALVGPRPPLPSEVQQYSGDLHRRLLVTPGMTGLWQVSGRSDLSLHESTRLDLYYVDNWSLLYDIEIVLRTIRAVISGHGAY